MNPEKWQKIKAAFNQAVELEKAEREVFLRRLKETEIRAEVSDLLAAEAENNFAEPIAKLSQIWPEESAATYRDKMIGSYKIIREIGRGGMGIVFEAVREKEDFSQIVALKLLKRGMDSDAMLRRFRHERQILAWLEHVNVARLLDGGLSEDGVPFFAMEYVQGQAIDDFCRENRLSIY